jgi:hypothetical protein
VEAFIQQLIFKRIVGEADKRIDDRQFGFRAGRGTRNATFVLLRRMERATEKNESMINVFVDFRKAFDSVGHDEMLEILKHMGCPDLIVTHIKRVYDAARIRLRWNKTELGKPARQSRGIRQGSTLSPLLFILALDFVMKVAGEFLGAGPDFDWLGYADDLELETKTSSKAESALQTVQQSVGYIKLELAPDKTVVLAVNAAVRRTATEDACMEKVVVHLKKKGKSSRTHDAPGELFDFHAVDKIFNEAEKKELALDTAVQTEFARLKATHFIVMRSGRWAKPKAKPCIMRESWIEFPDGRKIRFTKTGDKTFAKGDRRFANKCAKCDATFPDKSSLRAHERAKICLINPTLQQQKHRRVRRQVLEKRRGSLPRMQEDVMICEAKGKVIKTSGQLKYLGTQVTYKANMNEEIRKRSAAAIGKITEVRKIWRSKAIKTNLKRQLFDTLVLSILLFNAETWVLNGAQTKAFEATYERLVRIMTRDSVKKRREDGSWESRKEFYTRHKVRAVEEMIRQRRIMWAAQILKGKDPKTREELEKSRSGGEAWWLQLSGDLNEVGMSEENLNDPLGQIKKRLFSSASES